MLPSRAEEESQVVTSAAVLYGGHMGGGGGVQGGMVDGERIIRSFGRVGGGVHVQFLRLVWTMILPLRGPAPPCPIARLAAFSCARTPHRSSRCFWLCSYRALFPRLEEGKRAVLVGFPSALAWLRMGRGESGYVRIYFLLAQQLLIAAVCFRGQSIHTLMLTARFWRRRVLVWLCSAKSLYFVAVSLRSNTMFVRSQPCIRRATATFTRMLMIDERRHVDLPYEWIFASLHWLHHK